MFRFYRPRSIPAACLALSLLAWVQGALALSGPAAGRADFLRAERALRSGDRATFESLLTSLTDYPLYPYLRYAQLQAGPWAGGPSATDSRQEQEIGVRAVDQADPGRAADRLAESFLADFPDTPMAELVRAAYLKRLADAGLWADYARIDRPDDSAQRRCLYRRALLETGREAEALDVEALESLWLSPESQPAACDPVFAAWRRAGGLGPQLVWARIRLAMEAGEIGLARHLGTWLPEAGRSSLALWLEVHAKPALVEDAALPLDDHPMAAALLAHGLGRLAGPHPERAAAALGQWRWRLEADPAAWDLAHERVARALVRTGQGGSGLSVWDQMSARPDNLDAQEDRVRAAIGLGDWRRAAQWIERLPAGEQKDDRWLYWLGLAQDALGQESEAGMTLARAATRRSLWGFLAADRLGLPYNLEHRPTPAAPLDIAHIASSPAFARIRELSELGRETDVRREWRTLTRDLDQGGLMAAAWIADLLGRHDQAIFTLARTGYWDDLRLRFPLRHRDLVAEQAWQTGLPEDWIFAVIRQESVFNPTVASSAGALGLMQLMPATARQVAQGPELDRTAPGRGEILQPEVNIALGSTYLAWMRDRFGHVALATAAYNAGPHRVERWRPRVCTDADRWILSIPFDETRGYVERVLAYRVIYRARLGLPPERLSDQLPAVAGAAG